MAAFEQSLTSMTGRLHQLNANAEKKDTELTELRQTIERLRKSSIQAGLTSAHMQSMGVATNNLLQPELTVTNSVTSGASSSSNNAAGVGTQNNQSGVIQRHHSTDSMCSLNSLSSGCSTQDKKKKKGWLRSSFTKAFSRNAKIAKTSRHINNSSLANNSDGNHHQQSGSSASATLTNGSSNHNNHNDSNLPPASPNKSPHKMVTVVENGKFSLYFYSL